MVSAKYLLSPAQTEHTATGRAEISETECRNKETLGPAEVGEMRRASEKGKTKGMCWPGNQGSQEAVGMTFC